MHRRAFFNGAGASVTAIATAGCMGYEFIDSDEYSQQQQSLQERKDKIENLETKNEELQGKIDNLETKEEELQEEINELETARDEVESENNQLRNELAEVEQEVQELEREVESAFEEGRRDAIVREYSSWYSTGVEFHDSAVEDYNNGYDAGEQNNYTVASRYCARAAGYYDGAARTFEIIENWTQNNGDSAATNIASESKSHCENMSDACAYYAVAFDALDDGNQSYADSNFNEGDRYYDQAHNYQVSSSSEFDQSI